MGAPDPQTNNYQLTTAEVAAILRLAETQVLIQTEAFFSWKNRIVASPDILGGEPVFAGTRLAVRHIGALVENKVSVEEIKLDYPSVTADDIRFAHVFFYGIPQSCACVWIQ